MEWQYYFTATPGSVWLVSSQEGGTGEISPEVQRDDFPRAGDLGDELGGWERNGVGPHAWAYSSHRGRGRRGMSAVGGFFRPHENGDGRGHCPLLPARYSKNQPMPEKSREKLTKRATASPAAQCAPNVAAFQKGFSHSSAKPSAMEQFAASSHIGELVHQSPNILKSPSKEDVQKIAKLVRVAGRRRGIFGGPHYSSMGTAGQVLDSITHAYQKTLANGGDLPPLSPSAPTSTAMAKKLALYTGGSYEWRHPTTWATSHGGRHRDPSDHVGYPSRGNLENAWGMLRDMAEEVTYLDHLDSERKALKFGKYLLERATVTSLSGTGRVDFLLSVRTFDSLKNLVILSPSRLAC